MFLSLDTRQILQCPACAFELYQLILLYPIDVQTVNNITHKKEWSIEEFTRPRSLEETAVKSIISDQQNKLLVIQTAVLLFVIGYDAPTAFLSISVVILLGRSSGKPRARDQTKEESTPKARDTPNNTV